MAESYGTLYLVGTPIGNLEDITYRAVRTLSEVDLIAAEDTRHSLRLLNHLGIKKPLISYHDNNRISRAEELVKKLKNGQNIALISDAGMPGISDPGGRTCSPGRFTGNYSNSCAGVLRIINSIGIIRASDRKICLRRFFASETERQSEIS